MNKFFTTIVKPTFTMTSRDLAAFDDGDVLVDWFAFDVPNGGNNLVSAYMITEIATGGLQTFHPEVFFARDIVVNGKILAPTFLGLLDGTALGSSFENHLLGFLQAEENSQVATTLDFTHIARLSTIAKNGNRPDLIIQGEPDTGTSKGLSRIYVGITTVDGDPDFRSTVTTNGGGTAGDATLTVDTSNAFRRFSAGDQLIDEDEQELGTIESINTVGTTITFDKNGLLNTVADGKRVGTKTPIKLVLGFER
tara:strand:- start:1879 stop:2634 length:756 start_codon:yes stop_codon:yes gene_type:complete